MNQYEKIVNMSIDEMAESDYIKCPFHENKEIICEMHECDCVECIKSWLNSSVKI